MTWVGRDVTRRAKEGNVLIVIVVAEDVVRVCCVLVQGSNAEWYFVDIYKN